MAVSGSSIEPARLSRLTKFAYGAGDLGPAIVTAINGFFLNAFLLDVARLRPGSVAVIFLIVKLWDSVNDPFIGVLTDRTSTRWGRRRPWLLFGAVPFGAAFLLHWLVPPLGPLGMFWYYLVVALLLDMAFTAVNVPYAAMTPTLTADYDERTNLNSYRFAFSILGGVSSAFLHTLIVGAYPDVLLGHAVSAALWAFLIIGSSLVTFTFTREGPIEAASTQNLRLVDGLRSALRNRAFVTVTMIYLLSWLCLQFVQANLLLYVRYWIGAEDLFGPLVLTVQLSSFIFLLFWARRSEHMGKQRIYYYGMSFWVATEIALFFLLPGQIGPLFVLGFLSGVGVSIAFLVPWSMLPDVLDLDELQTGVRREGIYYGIFVFLQKLGLSLGLAASNLILEAAGYISPEEPGVYAPSQPEPVLLALRVFVSLVPAAILLASFLVVRRYPITRERHRQIQEQLRAGR